MVTLLLRALLSMQFPPVLLLLFSGKVLALSAQTISLIPNLPVVPAGSEVLLEVHLTGADELDGFSVAPTFDPAAFFYVPDSIDVCGTAIENFIITSNSESIPGTIVFVGASASAATLSDEVLLRFRLRAREDYRGPAVIRFNPENTKLNEGEIPLALTERLIEVSPPEESRTLSITDLVEVEAGSQVRLEVSLDVGESISGFVLGIELNDAGLKYVPGSLSTLGGIVEDFDIQTNDNVSSSTLVIVGAGTAPLPIAGGLLCSFELLIPIDAQGEIPITFSTQTSLNEGAISFLASGGVVRIVENPQPIVVSMKHAPEIASGTQVKIVVHVENASSLQSFQWVLKYDSEALSYLGHSIQTQGMLGDSFVIVDNLHAGSVTFVGAAANPSSSESGGFLSFRFAIKPDVSGSQVLEWDQVQSTCNEGSRESEFRNTTLDISGNLSSRLLSVSQGLSIVSGASGVLAIEIDDAAKLNGFVVTLAFDQSRLTFLDGEFSSEGSISENFLLSVNSSGIRDRIVIAGVSATGMASGGGVLLYLPFAATSAEPGAVTVTIDPMGTSLNDGGIDFTSIGGSVQILGSGLTTTLALPVEFPVTNSLVSLVPLAISDCAGINGFEIALDYDPSALEVVEAGFSNTGTLTEGFHISSNVRNEEGKLVIVGASGVALPGGSGTLLHARFRPMASAKGVYAIAFDSSVTNLNEGAIESLLIDGSLSVSEMENGVNLSIDGLISLPRGGEAEVPISISEGEGVTGFVLAIDFDSSRVGYVPGSYEQSGTLSQGFLITENSTSFADTVILVGARSTPLDSGGGELIRFKMRDLGGEMGLVYLSFSEDITSLNDGNLGASLNGGSLNIVPAEIWIVH